MKDYHQNSENNENNSEKIEKNENLESKDNDYMIENSNLNNINNNNVSANDSEFTKSNAISNNNNNSNRMKKIKMNFDCQMDDIEENNNYENIKFDKNDINTKIKKEKYNLEDTNDK